MQPSVCSLRPPNSFQDLIYGMSRYASGCPYGSSVGYYIDYRPFPFVFWLVPIHDHYYCQDDCASTLTACHQLAY
jgi:hypothetical protein